MIFIIYRIFLIALSLIVILLMGNASHIDAANPLPADNTRLKTNLPAVKVKPPQIKPADPQTKSAEPSLVAGDYGPPHQGTLEKALAAIGARNRTLVLTPGLWKIVRPLTIPGNITLKVESGAVLEVAPEVGLTIAGGLDAGLYPIFSGAGKVSLIPGVNVNAVWFTSRGNGTNPNPWEGSRGGGGLGEALARVPGAHVFELPSGKYLVTETINVNRNGVIIRGNALGLTNREGSQVQIEFRPSQDSTLFNFDNTTDNYILWHCALSGVFLHSTEGNHTAVKCVDVSACAFRDLYIWRWHGTGIDFRGRDLTVFQNISITADAPLVIQKNPKHVIDIDATVFRDLALTCTSTGDNSACVTISGITWLTNVTFEGHQGWMKGKYGLYWNDTASHYASQGLYIQNVKSEQAQPKDGRTFHISLNNHLFNLVIQRCGDNSRTGGFIYLKNVRNAYVGQCYYFPKVAGEFITAINCPLLKVESIYTRQSLNGKSPF
jgi:hypothetical protein